MKLFEKSEEAVEFQPYFSVNDPVKLDLRGKTYTSRVEDITDHGVLVAWPASHGVLLPLLSNQDMVLTASDRHRMRQFECNVIERCEGPPAVLCLHPHKALGPAQHRESVRIPDVRPLSFRVLNERGLPFGRLVKTTTREISANGVRALAPREDKPCVNDHLWLEMELPTGAFVQATGKVIRVDAVPGNGSVFVTCVQFTKMGDEDSKRLFRHVCGKQVQLRKAGLM